jgi:hypothetical protein
MILLHSGVLSEIVGGKTKEPDPEGPGSFEVI